MQELSEAAWLVAKNARLIPPGKTQVGCAVLADNGEIYTGCNTQHKFRSPDIHAEVNAMTTAIASGVSSIAHTFVVARRDFFTPCGSCMDWIFEMGGPDSLVSWQNDPVGEITTRKASEMMPYYPY